MKKNIVLAFDMDNTICDTNSEVLKLITEFCIKNNSVEMEYLIENKGLSVSYFKGKIVDLINKEVIEKRVYMDTAKPSGLVGENNELKDLLLRLKKEVGGIKIVVCTHRGDNVSAWMSTYNYLVKHDLIDCFDMIHSINHINNKNKIDFLKGYYKESEILLVDDNPFGSKSRVYDYCKEVLIYGEIDNFDGYCNQNFYKGHEDLFKIVVGLI